MFTLAHLSDIHLAPLPDPRWQELIGKRLTGYINWRRKRQFVPVPDSIASFFAAIPLTPMNSDQWKLLKRGSVPTGLLPGLDRLGVTAKPMGLFLHRWMIRYRKHGRFADKGLGPGGTLSPAAMRFAVREAPRVDPRDARAAENSPD